MHASELVGKYAIRRAVTILSEESKLMDTSYTDPNKPVYIKDYSDGKIVLLSFDGIRTILTGEYDDDKWVAIGGVAYKDVIVPAGYKSISAVYKYIDQRNTERRSMAMSTFNQTATSILRAILDVSMSSKEKIPYIVIKFYINDDTYATCRMYAKVIHTKSESKAMYSFERSSQDDLLDTNRLIVIKNDSIFANGISRLLRNGALNISNINAIQYAVSSRFGYDGINAEKDLLVDFNEAKFIIILSVIDMYKVFIADNHMYIAHITTEQLLDMESQFITAILDIDESMDLENKMVNGTYDCNYLRLG